MDQRSFFFQIRQPSRFQITLVTYWHKNRNWYVGGLAGAQVTVKVAILILSKKILILLTVYNVYFLRIVTSCHRR